MRLLIQLIVLSAALTSCSLPVARMDEDALGAKENGGAQLFNIRIERWSTLRFSGLLALQERSGGLYYTLLDTTGIKILEAQMEGDGSYSLVRGHPSLRYSRLTILLSKALARIYLFIPKKRPCSRDWLLRLCHKKDDNNAQQKYAQMWPITLWRVSEGKNGDKGEKITIYSQPLFGIRLLLKKITSLGEAR